MSLPLEVRRKRAIMRAAHRGMKEMDIVLGDFAAARLHQFDAAAMDAFEALLAEPDPDLYAWVAGRAEPPAAHAALIAEIRAFVGSRFA